jgi:hypothetical protein
MKTLIILSSILQNLKPHYSYTSKELAEDINKFFSAESKYEITYGNDKVVIIPPDEEIVYKIPLRFPLDSLGETENEETSAYYCLSRIWGWDSCKAEYELSLKANENGLGQFFAKTNFIGVVRDFPIYTQEKCVSYKDFERPIPLLPEDVKGVQNFLEKTCHIYYAPDLKEDFIADLIQNYGEEDTKQFLNFLDILDILDLHEGNYGYDKNNLPVLIDYQPSNDE